MTSGEGGVKDGDNYRLEQSPTVVFLQREPPKSG
jgi:hypothetical protein